MESTLSPCQSKASKESSSPPASDEVDLPKKCSWSELRSVVKDLRKEMASLSSLVPMHICFRRQSTSTVRVYYLVNWGIPLLYVDIKLGEAASEARLKGHQAMSSLPELMSRRSRSQQLLSERQRAVCWGAISSYSLHPSHPTLIFPMAGDLHMLEEEDGSVVHTVLHTGGSAPLTPAMCPQRASLVAHAADGDMWLVSRRHPNRCPLRLTYAEKGSSKLSDDPRNAGEPCYVMQEEFSRYTGFWWQPKSNDNVYRILYEEVDQSQVKILYSPTYNTTDGEMDEFRFPRAGTANAKSTLRLLQFTIQDNETRYVDHWETSDNDMMIEDLEDMISDSRPDTGTISDPSWLDLRKPLEEVFSWMEYVVRVGWTPCGQYVWCQLLDRRQQRLELVLIFLQDFSLPFVYPRSPHQTPQRDLEPPWIAPQVLVSERAPSSAWINVHDILHFLETSDDKVVFIWASEETGHLHLYLITCTLDVNCVSPCAGPNITSKVALTQGEWEVIGRKIWVDEERGLVYFVGLKETPLERHLYCTSYREPQAGQDPRLLTQPGFSYAVDMDEECTLAVCTYSNIHVPPACTVYELCHPVAVATCLSGGEWQPPKLRPRGSLMDAESPPITAQDWEPELAPFKMWRDRPQPIVMPSVSLSERCTPELYTVRVDEQCWLHALVYRPLGAIKPRPTLLHVYGGPVVQTVTNTYKGMRQLRMHMAAAQGYCVVCIDSRGSKHRGVKFESHIRGRMGTVELDDQIKVLKWLAEQTGCIDLNRVAVHGWSYGGYLSLMALARHPEVFKVCIACAPVTSWELYDTAYTERYMDLPTLNPLGYARGSVIKLADMFPNEENRLLLVHGLQDENVHFLHTQQLIEALIRAGKPYQLQVYPNERHSLRYVEASAHYEATLLSFLQNYL